MKCILWFLGFFFREGIVWKYFSLGRRTYLQLNNTNIEQLLTTRIVFSIIEFNATIFVNYSIDKCTKTLFNMKTESNYFRSIYNKKKRVNFCLLGLFNYLELPLGKKFSRGFDFVNFENLNRILHNFFPRNFHNVNQAVMVNL